MSRTINQPWSEEKVLVAACQQGDPNALQEVIRCFQRPVYATSLRILGNRAEAEESTQDTFFKVLNKIGTFRLESSLSTWIYRIALHTALNRRQSWLRKLRHSPAENATEDWPDRSRPDPEQQAERGQLLRLVEKAIHSLPEEQRLALILGDLQGLNCQEVAAALQIPVGTAKSRLHRARASLRDRLAPHLSPRLRRG